MRKLNLDGFLKLDPQEQEEYVKEKMELDDLWVLGTVKNIKMTHNYFYIENIVNPYTHIPLNFDIFSDVDLKEVVICPISRDPDRLEDNAVVMAKIIIKNGYELKQNNILFSSVLTHIYYSENFDKSLGFVKEHLPVVALVTRKYHAGKTTAPLMSVNSIIEKLTKKFLEEKKFLEKKQMRLFEEEQQRLLKVEEGLKAKSDHVAREIEWLQKFGFAMDIHPKIKQEKKSNSLKVAYEPANMIGLIQDQLLLRGYQYRHNVLRQLLIGISTGQMIILIGPSGTGKTTIVKQLADVIDAQYEIIPVQPSWTDKQDLIGFYNPIRQLFVPSPFLDCLIKAKEHPERLFFICLDEMNLAQIEYYLADLLSILEIEGEKLRLYSDFEYEQNKEELNWYMQHVIEQNDTSVIHSLEHFRMQARQKNLERYPSKIDLPKNIRIIGTMNVDGTVQNVSPKITDRSFIIPMNKQKNNDLKSNSDKIGHYSLTVDYFEIPPLTEDIILKNKIKDIKNKIEMLGITYNDRVEKHILQYCAAAKYFKVDDNEQLDDITLMKFLPRLHDTFSTQEIESFISMMEGTFDNRTSTYAKLKDMKHHMSKTTIFSYWS